MHIDRHTHQAKAAYALLVLTLAFVGYIFYKFPDIRSHYLAPIHFVLQKNTNVHQENVFSIVYTQDIATSAAITEFGTTSNFILIDENTDTSITIPTSTIDQDVLPTILEDFSPSPESQWASVYLNILGTNFDTLDLNIEYVRNWQQTGGFMRDLRQGLSGTDVTLLQYLLHKFDPSFSAKNITGTFGPKTKSSLASLQSTLQLKPTGIFDGEIRFFFDSVFFKELCPDADPEQDKTYENVGRRISVPLDYIPSDLIRIPRTVRTVGIMCLSKEPAKRLEDMFAAAKQDGHELAVFSAYRSSRTQKLLAQYHLSSLGKAGLAGVAEAGHSEHQLGTTVDISGKSIGYAGPSQKFGSTPEGKWLEENSYKYGFILSYPQGKQKDTGYIYEPWHFRYVGIDTARDIFQEKLTIQEYFNLVQGEGYSLEAEEEI